MATHSFKPAKGTKDWYGKETIIRDFIRDNLRETFERYGYDRLETAPIEGKESVEFKGGGEIQKEVFKLKDRGERGLALRFDQTLPLARYVASGSGISLPFKRYAIGEVFRDGPTQPEQGRYRVFTQCDVDILGVSDMSAEAELIMLAKDSFNAVGLGGIEANINNRKLLDGILDYANISEEARQKVIISLDKMDKIGMDGVRTDLEELTFGDDVKKRLVTSEQVNKILEIIKSGSDNYSTLNGLKKLIISDRGKEGLSEVEQLLNYASDMKINFLRFNPVLARGLDYYTGTTMEVFLEDKNLVPSAILAGGRFDNMIGDFMGNGKNIPAVGFSFGLERLAVILNNKKEFANTKRQAYIIPIGDMQGESLKIAHELRNQGLRVDMKLQKCGKIKNGVEYAVKHGINYAIFIGEKEILEKNVKIKNLKTGHEEILPIKDIKNYINQNNLIE